MDFLNNLLGGRDPALNSEDRETRRRAVEAIGNSGDAHAIDLVTKMLSDSDHSVASTAATALGRLNHPHSVQPLVDVIHADRNDWVTSEAERALAGLTNPQTIDHLIRALGNSEDSEIDRAVGKALRGMGAPAVAPLISALKSTCGHKSSNALERISRTVVQMGRVAVSELIVSLADAQPEMRVVVADILADIGGSRAEDALAGALKDNDPDVRWAVLRGLARWNDVRAIEPLVAALQDGDVSKHESAIELLCKIRDKRATLHIIHALKHPSSDVRTKVMIDLGYRELYSSEQQLAVEQLTLALKDSDRRIRLTAVDTLGKLRAQRALGPILEWWNELVQDVKQHSDYETAETFQEAVESLVLGSDSLTIRYIPDHVLFALSQTEDAPMNLHFFNADSSGCRLDRVREQTLQELARRGLDK